MVRTLFLLFVFAPFFASAQAPTFTISADTLCSEDCLTLISTTTAPFDIITWYIPGVGIPALHSDTAVVCNLPAGTHIVKLFKFYSGSVDSAAATVWIKQAPHPPITFDSALCRLSVPAIYSSYQWYEYGGGVVIGGSGSSITAPMASFYVIVDSNGCLGSSDTVMGCPELSMNSPGPDNFEISIYPNPASTSLTITSATPISRLSIENTLGVTAFKCEQAVNPLQLDVSALRAGVYFIHLNNTEVKRFLKD